MIPQYMESKLHVACAAGALCLCCRTRYLWILSLALLRLHDKRCLRRGRRPRTNGRYLFADACFLYVSTILSFLTSIFDSVIVAFCCWISLACHVLICLLCSAFSYLFDGCVFDYLRYCLLDLSWLLVLEIGARSRKKPRLEHTGCSETMRNLLEGVGLGRHHISEAQEASRLYVCTLAALCICLWLVGLGTLLTY